MKQIIVIPARMRGTRLPGKPMIDIAGKPMIKHVWDKLTNLIIEEFVKRIKLLKTFVKKII